MDDATVAVQSGVSGVDILFGTSSFMREFSHGKSVDEAVWWFVTMDRSCQAQLLAEAAGKPISIDRENALVTRSQVGTHVAGWFQFQPLWQRIIREQPDLFD